jgi:hypothetical protein
MKHPNFELDKKFIMMYVKVLIQQKKYREALEFIENKQSFFENKQELQTLEADLYLKSNNALLTIQVYFNMLRLNSHISQFRDMWDVYKSCIRLILNDYIPKELKYEYKANIDYMLNTGQTKAANFEPITNDDTAENILEQLYLSIKNLSKHAIAEQGNKR